MSRYSLSALAVAAALSVAACEEQPRTGWAIVEVFDVMMLAVDLESISREDDSVTIKAVSVFSEPVDIMGRPTTHIVAELEYSCPPSTVLNRYEWRYDDNGMFQEGPTGLPVEQFSSPVHQSLAAAACGDTIGKTDLPIHSTLDDVVADHREYLAYQSSRQSED